MICWSLYGNFPFLCVSLCSHFSAVPLEGDSTLLGVMRGYHIRRIDSSMRIQPPPIVTGSIKCSPLKLLSSSSLDVSV